MSGQFFQELNIYTITLRMLLAMLFGGIVGIDRGRKRRAAGLRTYMLVCLGSALVMITNQYIADIYSSDLTRMGAQVISGIGFLGAGTIIVTSHNQVKGLTTAAGLWASACLGLAIGIGFYEGAAIASILILFIVSGMHKFDRMVISHSRNMDIYAEFQEDGQLSSLLSFMHEKAILVVNVEFTKSRFNNQDPFAVLISLHLPARCPHDEVLNGFSRVDGIYYIEEI